MDTDRNLLFGVLALQVDAITVQQFAEACTHWTAKKDKRLSDVFVDLGWISQTDKADIDRFVERKLRKHNGDVRASLAASTDDTVNRTLGQIDDKDVEQSLLQMSEKPLAAFVTTVNFAPEHKERYDRSSLYASGGLGRVWLARDNQLHRNVALKDIQPQRAGDPTVVKRFLNEAQITGQLDHPGVVPVYELRCRPDDQQPFYTMRFIRGRTLREAIGDYHDNKRGKTVETIDLVGLLSTFVAVCNTVAYAHSRGVIHRDLKGENVILGDYGEVHVLDWGLAKLLTEPNDEPTGQQLQFDSDVQLTMDGQALGTPAYMAPEQAEGKLEFIDQRTDIYGLGAILYEILAGRPPFTGSNLAEILMKIRTEEPIRPTRLSPEAPKNLEAVCLRAMAKKPADRYQSASELASVVQHWQESQRRQAIQELKDSEALYHGLVETLPLVIWRKDREGRFQFVNRGFCELFGMSVDDIGGKTDFDCEWREHAERFRRDDLKVLETGECLEHEEVAITADGRKFYSRTFKAPVKNAAGETIGTQGFLWDVTEHNVVLEKLRDAEAELKRLRVE